MDGGFPGGVLVQIDKSLLSTRELEVLNYAVEGLTDHQIAQRMRIAASTVNSYWVRIRGKLGHYSRTELVSALLKNEARERLDEFKRSHYNIPKAPFEESQIPSHFFREAIELLPDALLLCNSDGRILFANDKFRAMFGFTSHDVIGEDIGILLPNRSRATDRGRIAQCLKSEEPCQLGIGSVIYGYNRLANDYIRTIMQFASLDGLVSVVVIRDFMEDIEMRRRITHAYGSLI